MKNNYDHCQSIIDNAWNLVRALDEYKEYRLSKLAATNHRHSIEMMRAIISPVHGLISWATGKMSDE